MPVFKFNLYADDVFIQAQEIEADTAQDAVDKAIEGYERGEYVDHEEKYDSPGDVNEVHIIDNETDDVLLEYTPPDKAVKMAGPDLLAALIAILPYAESEAESLVQHGKNDDACKEEAKAAHAAIDAAIAAVKKAGGSYGA